VWEQRVPATAGAAQRVLPDGCLDLIWVGGELLVAGPDAVAHLAAARPGSRYVGLRFPPGVGPTVLGVPADELRDRRVPLDQVWPARRVARLAAALTAAGDAPPGPVLEAAAADRLAGAGPPDPALIAAAGMLRAGHAVAATAAALGWSGRRLHRRALTAFGYGPKTLARILRFERALAQARTGTPLATVAADTGYADQAHLSRDAKVLAGAPLRDLLG
jgi:AraC-like DNA-binding protein